jgi:NAD(P)-dependent dehydrogenase (short-subunit alcohol dehydrogenase family)
MELAGRVALVTGAGRRLGLAIARGLVERGMDVAVHHHSSADGAAELVALARHRGRRAEAFAADLRDAAAARELPGRVVEHFGRLDVLVNSAAVMVRQPVADVTPESWDATMDLNLRAAFFCAQGALPHLRAAGGRIVNLADVAGFEPWPDYVVHCVSKAGMVMLTRALARVAAPEVTVNAVAPGAVLLPDEWGDAARRHFAETTPLRRLGRPEDVVQAVLYLLEGGDYVTGEVLVVDGGRLLR